MAELQASYIAASAHPADTDRLVLEGLLNPPALPVSGAGYGVGSGSTELKVQAKGTPNMSVDVLAGHGWIDGTEGANQGTYHVYNDATVNLVISAAHATLARKDLVVAKVQDASYSGATNAWSLAVVTGTAAASPAEPVVPANAIVLALVDVAAAAASITNANITDRRRRASALGGVVVCTSATRPTTGLYEGLTIYETDTDSVQCWSGTAWEHVATIGAFPTWTPQLWQNANVAAAVDRARYVRGPGRRVEALCLVTPSAAGASGVAIEIRNLPIPAVSASGILGVFRYFDAGSTIYTGTVFGATTTSVRFQVSGNGNPMGTNPTFAIASSDSLWMSINYEAAS